MNSINWKKLTPHIIALVIFILAAVVYCKPTTEGKVVTESDMTQWRGEIQQMQLYKNTHGHFPLWSNSMFSGMPGFQIALEGKNPVSLAFFHDIFKLWLPIPIAFFFLLCISLYFLAQVLRINPWISIIAALAYAYASFTAILVVAGHETEILAMGYVPFLLGSVLLIYEGKYWWGTALTGLFSLLLISVNHLQITYYFIIVAVFMTIAYVVQWIRTKQYKHLVLSLVLVGVAGASGVITNATTLLTTYDFSKETQRNGGLSLDMNTHTVQKSAGLPIDYAFQWSYLPAETFNLVVPNIYGGASTPLAEDGKLAEALGSQTAGGQPLPQQLAQQLYGAFPAYWGNQQFTSGPSYLGAVMTLLFIFGLVYVRSKHKWWLLAVTILAIVMAWGKNFPLVNEFLFYHLPLYNKFRAPTMSLVIPQLTFAIMAMLCLQQLFFGSDDKALLLKKFKTTAIATGLLLLILVGMYATLSYESDHDKQIEQQLAQMTKGDNTLGRNLVRAAASDRQSLFGKDLLRSILFIAIAGFLLFLYIKGKVKTGVALAGVGLLVFIDLISVDVRYLGYDNYLEPEESTAVFNPSPADQQIGRDTSYFRVLNLASDTWQDAQTSYFHNSLGGYNAAKLALYQDLINYQLGKQPINTQVINMLNAKYVITPNRQTNQPEVMQNPEALGAAWFVQHIEFVDGAAAAMNALDHFSARDTAVVENSYKQDVPFTPQHDSSAYIRLIRNDNDLITYASSSSNPEFAVFSEIFYNRGWKAYIDDKEAPIVKTDYALRGLAVPAGKHQIRFEFKPASYYTGEKMTTAGSIFIVLLLLGALFQEYRVYTKKSANSKPV
jgi:hypothetical protein